MIILIGGATHTGKTVLAQRLLETYHYPYLSMDHLKMGLIRSGNTELTVFDDEKMTDYLWPIIREIVKTAIENHQNLIVEGCYIPFSWKKSFSEDYARHIFGCFLIMSHRYIEAHFHDIRAHANDIETRLDDSGLVQDLLIQENVQILEQCKRHGCEYVLIEDSYDKVLQQFVSKIR